MELAENGLDDEKYVLFKQDDLFVESFPLMKEIRRQGKLCDVTLKVSLLCLVAAGGWCRAHWLL